MKKTEWDNRRQERMRRRVHAIRMADLAANNSLAPANSTNGVTFDQLMSQLKGERA